MAPGARRSRNRMPLVARQSGLWSELKRRRVLRVAGAYLAAGFVALQAADYLFRALLFPDWAFRLAVLLVFLGFLIAVPLAWAYDLGPGGIRRTDPPDEAAAGREPERLVPMRVAAAAVVAGVVLAGGGWWVLHGRGTSLDRHRVVVAAFDNRTGDPALAPLGEMAADWITQGLTETGVVEVVDASTALAIGRRAARDATVGDVRFFSREAAAGLVVTGRYYLQGDSVNLVAQVVDGGSGKVLRAVGPFATARATPIDGARLLRRALVAQLAVLLDEPLARFQALEARPPSYEAYREYMQGLTLYLRGRQHDAADHFAGAFALDTGFHRALLWAAQAATFAGAAPGERPFQRGDSLLALLASARQALSPAEQYQLDFVRALRRFDLRAAYGAARLRRDAAPGSDDAIRELALSAARVGRFHESLELLRPLDPDRGLLHEHPEYRATLAAVQHAVGDFQGQLATTAQLAERFPESPLVGASDLPALAALGRTGEVTPLALELAERVAHDPAAIAFPALGDPGYAGATVPLDLVARELLAHGHGADAAAFVRTALRWCASRPPAQKAGPGYRLGWAHLLGQAGRWREADSVLTGVEAGTWTSEASLEMFRGVVAAKLGDRSRALALSAGLDKLPDEVIDALGDPPALPFRRAVIAAALGDRDDALRLLRQWKAAGDWNPLRLHSEPVLIPYFADPEFRKLLEPED